jgi:arylformamidase
MRLEDYPPQEPATPQAIPYRDACISGSFGVPFWEFSFGDDPHQSVALYTPAKPDGILFAFMHGGGWTAGYKETMGFMAPGFTSHGITFASVGYRLAPDHLFPAGLDDCADAVAALVRKAPSLGCDPEKLLIGGHSAGGHYASLLAVTRDWQARRGLPVDVVKGCLSLCGVYRFGEGSGLSMRPRFLGAEGNGTDRAASPLFHIEGRPPPFFIAYGENDFPHLKVQAVEMEKALREHGGDVRSIVLAGRTHFTSSLAGGEPQGPWMRGALDFLLGR